MVFKGFEVLNLSQLDYNDMISSQIPEEIILAILTNYEKEPPEQIIRSIINKLRKTSKDEAELNKFIKQLGMLSRLRNLEDITNKTFIAMPITYDIRKDALYKEGREEERKIQQEARQKQIEKIIISFLKKGNTSISEIASICDVSESLVRKLKKTLERK